MRLAISPRLSRFLKRVPRYSLLSATELLLMAVLAVQCARLFWAVVTPTGPLGDWRPFTGPDAARGRAILASGFDPFFRVSGSGPAVVTPLPLKLFGVRVDEATGHGSAIVAGPDNVQASFSVGEAIQPGVILKAVGHDSVVIERGGTEEKLYLDQSSAAPIVTALPPPADSGLLSTPPNLTASPGTVSLKDLQANLSISPRQNGGRVTGIVVRGDPAFLARLGLQPGDVVVQVSGRAVANVDDLQRAAAALNGGTLSIAVERGVQLVPVAINISGS